MLSTQQQMDLQFNRPTKILFKRDGSWWAFLRHETQPPVPELTRSADIKLNPRVSLRDGPSTR
jgi:hypothetical protein